jgi:E3 ubiquitin-protein ligase ZNF598
MSRVRSMATNPQNADIVVKTAIRSYKASESSAKDLISTVWNILDNNVDNTATVVNNLVDLLDDEDKKTELLSAWNGFKIEVC